MVDFGDLLFLTVMQMGVFFLLGNGFAVVLLFGI